MSLISQLPLAAIWLSCKNIETSKRFYKDIIGLKAITDEEGKEPGLHFDLGNIRLSLRPRESTAAKGNGDGGLLPPGAEHLVFVVENQIETVYADLAKRGVKLRPKKVLEDTSGKAAWFDDPDGRIIYLWQPPRRESKNYKDVEALVRHYESVSRALADLREEEIPA